MTGDASLWEFDVRPEKAAEFARVYGPDGDWSALFRRAPGYVETLLLKDRAVPHRYVTVDRWASEEAYRRFKESYAEPYRELDERCAELTLRERAIGTYDA